MTIADNSLFSKIRYLSYFVIRAFVIAVFCLMILLFFFLIVYFGDLYFNVKSGNYKSPLFNGYVIVSPSMVPTIQINDAIIVKRENDSKYQIGDIISFFTTEYDHDGMVVTHRIIDKKVLGTSQSKYRTKGDNNPIPDQKGVSSENVYGKVLFVIPKLGYFQSFLSNSSHFILCIMIPVVFILLYDLIRIITAFQKNKNFS